jgi:hypothetical protein
VLPYTTGAKRPMDTNVLALDTNGILRWIQMFLMAFYYRHAEMTMRRGQKMIHIFLITYDILKINSLSGDAINPGLNDI